MPKTSQTILEIDLNALEHNYNYLKSNLSNKTKLVGVVKAFAYGSDAIQVSKKLENLKIDYLAVAFVEEGIFLRKAGIKTPIIVLHPQVIHFKKLIEACLEPCLYSKKIFSAFLLTLKNEEQTNYPIHLKFNTGLNRLGFQQNDILFLTNNIKKTNAIKVSSIFSHLAASEDLSEKEFTNMQIQQFIQISERFFSEITYQPLLHICNTSGIFNYPEAHFDMVRSGIGLYGFGNSEKENLKLQPIARLKTIISQIHSISKGETVGYNRAFKSKGAMKIATLPLGHADGINRAYGNGVGWVTIQGKKAPIIGNVCMDMMMIDVTNLECEEGDEVIVFGQNPTADQLSKAVQSISYELLTAVSQRVKRIFIE
ncbi:MAG: alanine racemase [Flavobacteriales bacterium]